MNSKILFFSLLVLLQNLTGQTKFYLNYDWDKKPVLNATDPKYKDSDYYTVKEKHVLEYAYNSNNELGLYETKHVITHINNDKGVEYKNKMYISSSKIIEMVDIRARCITASGKVINLDKNSIKQVDNFEDRGPYTIFAFEGVEPNCDIEYMYTSKKYVTTYGSFDKQFSFPQKNMEIDFITPKNLIFELKSYNGFPQFTSDTSNQKVNHLVTKATDIPEFETEKYSADEASRMYFSYHLRYNTATSKAKYYTWNTIGNDFITTYYKTEKDDSKAVSKLIDKSGAGKKATDLEKIKTLESYVKKNIIYTTEPPENLTLEKAVNQKVISGFLLNKLFVTAAIEMNINFELVFTNNRFECEFDGNFEGHTQLNELLIYFPSIGKYLTPANYYSRLGFPPAQFTYNKALYVKATEVSGTIAAITKIKSIPGSEYTASQNVIKAKVSFEGEDFTPKTNISHEFTGYSSFNIQPIFYVLTEEQKKESAESILKQVGENTVVKNYKVENTEAENILEKPFIINGNIETSQLVEKAGEKFLYKVGLIIGPQAELYQEKPRKNDIVLEYAHGFVRNIEIEIPAGYKISNLKDLELNVVLSEDNKETAYFKSTQKVEGNKLIVDISEQYMKTFYSKALYKEYKDVINAAADFNKVTLIFEKI
jgi:hypothetical protein